jgi:hypothetical protein
MVAGMQGNTVLPIDAHATWIDFAKNDRANIALRHQAMQGTMSIRK